MCALQCHRRDFKAEDLIDVREIEVCCRSAGRLSLVARDLLEVI
jgi:hypothetical protein